jgi:cell division protein FtsZ
MDSTAPLFHMTNVPSRGRVLVLGLGGAGCNSVARMRELWSEGPDCAVMDTDAQVLAASAVRRAINIGGKVTDGHSAGGDVTSGKLAAEESLGAIQEALDGYDVLFLVIGLGGGTATGAAPILVREARKIGLVTIAFATMPFPFEGDRRRLAAEEGLRVLQNAADTVICLPNQRLFELVGAESSVTDAFLQADAMVASGLHALWRLLSQTGVINLDLATLRSLAERSNGACAFGYADARGPARSASALTSLLNSPMLEKGRLLAEASALLVSITGGPDLTLADVDGIMGQIQKIARQGARVFMGAIIDPLWRDRLTLTVLVSENWLESRRAGGEGGQRILSTAAPGTAEATTDEAAEEAARKTAEQAVLNFQTPDRGLFDKGEPTIHLGQDLDIPTYIRRGIKLSFDH